MEKEIQEPGELIFLRYAFPATDCCSHGKVERMERAQFIRMLKQGGFPDRKRLEELFPNAIKYLKSWNSDDVRDYWCRRHNQIVADNPVCKVYGLQVLEVSSGKGDEVCRVSIGKNGEYPSYVLLDSGDFFTIHNLMVAEKLTSDQYRRYFSSSK